MKPTKSVLMPVALVVMLTLAVSAASFINRQANDPQVQGDPSSNATAVFPTNKQNEPTIAVNPTNANILLAGSNDEQRQPPCGPGPVRGSVPANDCSFFPNVGTSGIYRSTDGGNTWANLGLLDDQAGWIASDLVSDGDPVIVFGPKPATGGGFSYASGARAYYATLASFKSGRSPYPPNKATEALAVSYSDDNGTTWSAPVVATVKNNPNDFNDKESFWADNNPNSPFFGRTYISWTEFRSPLCCPAEPVMVAVSTNGGSSFSAPKQLSPAGNNGTGNGRHAVMILAPVLRVLGVLKSGTFLRMSVTAKRGVPFWVGGASLPAHLPRVNSARHAPLAANFRCQLYFRASSGSIPQQGCEQ